MEALNFLWGASSRHLIADVKVRPVTDSTLNRSPYDRDLCISSLPIPTAYLFEVDSRTNTFVAGSAIGGAVSCYQHLSSHLFAHADITASVLCA